MSPTLSRAWCSYRRSNSLKPLCGSSTLLTSPGHGHFDSFGQNYLAVKLDLVRRETSRTSTKEFDGESRDVTIIVD
jgi:hypothetical protein